MRLTFGYQSPLGPMLLTETDGALTGLDFAAGLPQPSNMAPSQLILEVIRQLDGYFQGLNKNFAVSLNPIGTAFQKATWEDLMTIDYGQTRTYGQVAARIGRPGAARAVGQAVHRNPLSIIIPCHRVIGADGALTGYGSGLDKKIFLLALENKAAAKEGGGNPT
ncbi:MAG: methylated-DNA--[protein]-cysteine S-methyltransferase [Deltaproteobacteria bacterium]|jgi:methylated-DNA-[protein]-cysteine S-methyltransferase|nr:methylated-DNA--[protein]-cysteine S-methyltransferase [Deltaproteobacteria bacterium]